jgi:RNA polymerase sigma factor (sigma-70 family)
MELTQTGDDKLLSMSAAGDQVAFADLYDRHAESVARYAWGWVQSTSDVQDLLQETFLTAWQKAATVDVIGSSALPWSLATCKNHARNRQRKTMRRHEMAFSEVMSEPGLDPQSEQRVRARWVQDEIAALDPIDRRICEMCLIEGASYAEVSAELGRSVAFVGKRLQRAKARLRKVVTADE